MKTDAQHDKAFPEKTRKKQKLFLFFVIGLSVTCTTWANDLPALGYSPEIPVKDLVAKGYRWVTVNGPYACPTEQEVRQITSDHTDLRELHMVENLQAYYLIPGTLARVMQDDHANGMSEILLAGISIPLWTYAKFLTARPIHDTYGIVETPDNAGLVDPSVIAKLPADNNESLTRSSYRIGDRALH
jgi:hypothetical protein